MLVPRRLGVGVLEGGAHLGGDVVGAVGGVDQPADLPLVLVPDDDQGALLEVTGKVAAKLDDGTVRVDLVATHAGAKVLGRAQAVVALG